MKNKIFKEQQNGYDRKQVDNYIKKLKIAYETVCREYLNAVDENQKLKKHFY